jgi:hypothetical protein
VPERDFPIGWYQERSFLINPVMIFRGRFLFIHEDVVIDTSDKTMKEWPVVFKYILMRIPDLVMNIMSKMIEKMKADIIGDGCENGDRIILEHL